MGLKMLLSLGLFIGVLYCFHILAQDYQAITAPKLLRLLFKRDTNSLSQHEPFQQPRVRWGAALRLDLLQCARALYCDLGARPPEDPLRRGFVHMLTLDTKEEDAAARAKFQEAYHQGALQGCGGRYRSCPLHVELLYDVLRNIVLYT